MSAFSNHLADANAILSRLRGSDPDPGRLLAELQAAGCVLSVDAEGKLRVQGKLTDQQKDQIRKCKHRLVRMVQGPACSSPVEPAEPWSNEEASDLLVAVQLRLDKQGWPGTPELNDRCGRLQDDIDAAAMARDIVGLRDTIRKLLDFLDAQYPRTFCNDGAWHDNPANHAEVVRTYNGWIRAKTFGKRWVCIVKDATNKKDVDEFLWDYSKNIQNCDIFVGESDVDPNKRNK